MSELTASELKWIKKLQKVLDECPSTRLGFYSIGDPSIAIYDNTMDAEIIAVQDNSEKDFCTAVDELDASFNISLEFPSHVHSTSG